MSELSPDEPSIATAGAARTGELVRGGTDPVAERRRAFDRERKRRASAKAPPAECQHAPPPLELREVPAHLAACPCTRPGWFFVAFSSHPPGKPHPELVGPLLA
jgi:hypothetical protein